VVIQELERDKRFVERLLCVQGEELRFAKKRAHRANIEQRMKVTTHNLLEIEEALRHRIGQNHENVNIRLTA
jgi:hypothetical protein